MRILIEKSARRLSVYGDGGEGMPLMCCPVALGRCPVGHKRLEGDGKTPEGEYTVCGKKPDSRHGKGLALSYPGAGDARAALEAGVIGQDVHGAIIARLDQGLRPPWGTVLGGEIYIHGGGVRGDWTAGCIALEDADMEALYGMVEAGCMVMITP